MASADAEVIRRFLAGESRWAAVLQELRVYHEQQMGKTITVPQWVGGGELGRLSWLGYYWHREMFWFGYGLRDGVWQPLVEADNRSVYSGVMEELRSELKGTWESVTNAGTLYRRLWAPASVAGESRAEFEWFKARSCELHEFTIQPGPIS